MVAYSRRSFTKLLGTVGASSLLWDQAIAELDAQGTIGDDTIRAMLLVQGGLSIFANPERFAELRAAVERTATRIAAMRAFPVPADIAPVVTFTRE